MQKHEKAALAAVTEVALAAGLTIEADRNGKSKLVMRMRNPRTGAQRAMAISNSPGDRDNMVKNARKQALRLAAEIADGK